MSRLVWLLWDAAAARMAERFLEEGALPNLEKLAGRGLRAAARPAWPCAQTPPGTATLVTGAATHVHGIYGFREAARPRAIRSSLETETGFDARRLRAEPLWTTAARAGKTAVLGFAPLASPAEVYAKGGAWGPSPGQGEILVVDGFGAPLAGQAVSTARDLVPASAPPPPPGTGELEETRGFRLVLPIFSREAADELLRAAPDPALGPSSGEHAAHATSLLVGTGRRRGRDRFELAWFRREGGEGPSVDLPVGESGPRGVLLAPTFGVTLLLLEIAPKGDDLLLWRSGIWRVRSSRSGTAEAVVRHAGPFVGAGAGHAYRDGLLGATCREGGSGLAERRYLGSLAASSSCFTRAGRFLLREARADLTFLYEPCIDETAHIFQDLVEDALSGKNGVDGKGLSVLREAYVLADRHLGEVMEEAGEDAIFAVTSDHGQQAVRLLFRPNAALREAGLLAVDESGRIDPSRTRALYGTAGNGYLVVNSEERPHGIVPRERVAETARQAAEALLARRGSQGEALILRAFFPGEETERGRIPGEDAGEAYLLAASGVALSTSAQGEVCEPANGGQHTSALDSPDLDALFVVGGPGVSRRGKLEARVDNRDVAPTLAALLGLPAPRHASGRDLLA